MCAVTAQPSPVCCKAGRRPVANSARHLLVVDDEPHIGLVLRPFLEQLGYSVSIAKTLDEARSALKAKPPDGLLLDLHLPDGSGLDFLRDLRNQGRTSRLPVLVLTAEGEDRILREARRLGAALVTKPFSPTKLTQRIALMFGDAHPDAGPGSAGSAS
ncbi:MAG: hypothetical protein DMD62_05090 [Gemmatimonadetes bacterium]|nr:MAG: hypothetical protein DMD62_05090 [Gemmatimonadota bacterium]